jgi:hypothetical protein
VLALEIDLRDPDLGHGLANPRPDA